MRCPFCNAPFYGDYPRKTAGVHTRLCDQCGRAFIIVIERRWWGYRRSVHIR